MGGYPAYREVYPWRPYYPSVYSPVYTPGYTTAARCTAVHARSVYRCGTTSPWAQSGETARVKEREASQVLKGVTVTGSPLRKVTPLLPCERLDRSDRRRVTPVFPLWLRPVAHSGHPSWHPIVVDQCGTMMRRVDQECARLSPPWGYTRGFLDILNILDIPVFPSSRAERWNTPRMVIPGLKINTGGER